MFCDVSRQSSPPPVRCKFGYNSHDTNPLTLTTHPLVSFGHNNRRVTFGWPRNLCSEDTIVPKKVVFEVKQQPFVRQVEEEKDWMDPRRWRAFAPDPNNVIEQKILLELDAGPIPVRRKDGDGYDMQFNFNTPRGQPNIYVSKDGVGWASEDFISLDEGEGFSPVFCVVDQKKGEVTYTRMASRAFWEGAGLSYFLYHVDQCKEKQQGIKNLSATMAKRDTTGGWNFGDSLFPFATCDLGEIYFKTQHEHPNGTWKHQTETDEQKFRFALFSFGAQLTKGMTDRFFENLMDMSNVLSSFSLYEHKETLASYEYNQDVRFSRVASRKIADGKYETFEYENVTEAKYKESLLCPQKRAREE